MEESVVRPTCNTRSSLLRLVTKGDMVMVVVLTNAFVAATSKCKIPSQRNTLLQVALVAICFGYGTNGVPTTLATGLIFVFSETNWPPWVRVEYCTLHDKGPTGTGTVHLTFLQTLLPVL